MGSPCESGMVNATKSVNYCAHALHAALGDALAALPSSEACRFILCGVPRACSDIDVINNVTFDTQEGSGNASQLAGALERTDALCQVVTISWWWRLLRRRATR